MNQNKGVNSYWNNNDDDDDDDDGHDDDDLQVTFNNF